MHNAPAARGIQPSGIQLAASSHIPGDSFVPRFLFREVRRLYRLRGADMPREVAHAVRTTVHATSDRGQHVTALVDTLAAAGVWAGAAGQAAA